MRCLFALLIAGVPVVPAAAQEIKPTVDVSTEYIMTLEVPIDTAQSVGHRLIVNVPAGGSVRGPKITGQLIPPGGDWLYPMPDGSLRLDVRETIETDDHALIFIEYDGIIVFSQEVLDRFNKGEVITATDGYSIEKGERVIYDIFAIR